MSDIKVSDYEEKRNKNIEDNRVILQKLMADFKETCGQGLTSPKKEGITKRRSEGSVIRRNPGRNARYNPTSFTPPRTRSRRGSVSSSISSASSSTTSPTSTPDKMVVRFGFFKKPLERDVSGDRDDDDEEILPSPTRVPRLTNHVKSVDEITDEDLEMVATYVSDKSYDSVYGTSCHQCRQKTNDFKTICRADNCYGVRGQFCGPCLRNRYGEDAKEALKNPDWACPPCRRICNCSFCRKKNGKSCTGIMIHLARERGYADVSSYLCSLKK